MTKQLLLAYCKANEITAHEIERELRPAGFQFEHLVCGDDITDLSFNERLQQGSQPLLLLLSDNYLKSVNPMHNILPTFQQLNSSGRFQCIIIDGWYPGREAGTFDRVPTTFDRIGQIIKYMNHWQEAYLELRHQSRSMAEDDGGKMEQRLKISRGISTQVGEFLRYLRGTDYWEFDKLKTNQYKALFQVFGAEAEFNAFAAQFTDKPDSNSTTAIPHSAKEVEEIEPPAEVILEDQAAELEEEVNDFVVEEIPGMDLLNSQENIPSGPALESTPKPSEGLPETPATNINAELSNPDNIVEESVASEELIKNIVNQVPIKKVKVPLEETDIKLEENMEEMIEEVAEEEKHRNSRITETTPEDKKRSYDILQSIFDDDEEEEENIEEDIPAEIPNEPLAQLQQKEEEEEETSELEQYLAQAAQAESNNDLLLAKSYYEKALSINPEMEEVNFKLGLITASFFTNQQKQASIYFKNAIKLNPENADSRYQYGMLLAEQMNKPDKAIRQFHKTLELQKDHPFANYDLALIYYKKGELDIAAEYYEEAFHINPELKTEENDLAFNYTAKDPLPENKGDFKVSNDWNAGIENLELVEEIDIQEEEEIIEEIPDFAKAKPQDIKTVLITGATSGIGLATAQIFAENGYRLILTGRRSERLDTLERKLKEAYDINTKTLCFDVRKQEAVKEALAQLTGDWGEVDILINNAGLAKGFSPIHEGDMEHWDTMIDTNIKGLLYMTRAIAPQMVRRGDGHIINVGSTAGKEVYPNGNVYCASKFAVDALTKSMRLDLHRHHIRVSQVAPGHVEETEFALVRFDGDKEKAKIYEDFQPLKAADVAASIYFIATRPPHVNIQDMLMMGTQQAGNNHIDRSGRGE